SGKAAGPIHTEVRRTRTAAGKRGKAPRSEPLGAQQGGEEVTEEEQADQGGQDEHGVSFTPCRRRSRRRTAARRWPARARTGPGPRGRGSSSVLPCVVTSRGRRGICLG